MANKVQGLPGLNYLSKEERQTFMLDNEEKLKKYRTAKSKEKAAEILWNNRLFKEKFGEDTFNKLNDGSKEAYEYRTNLLKDKVAGDAFKERFSPIAEDGTRDNRKGLGAEFEDFYGYDDPVTGKRIGGVSSDALIDVLNSDYLSPEEFEKDWNNGKVQAVRQMSWDNMMLSQMSPTAASAAMSNINGFHVQGASQIPHENEETVKQFRAEKNKRILEHIYNDEADKQAYELAPIVKKVYDEDPSIYKLTEEEVIENFKAAITPDKATGNMGVSEYASHYGDGSEKDVRNGDMDEFSVDEMRELLAKKKVYESYMSPKMASTALNNEAKRYIKEHQGRGKRLWLFNKDVLISSMSYTADKVNGIYNGYLAVRDLGDKPRVLINDEAQIVDPNKVKLSKTPDGRYTYTDEEGNMHTAHYEEVARTTLHNMGKNFDGSDAEEGVMHLNPMYWTRAEQFGTLDADKQKKYENLGSSPYKVAYDPNSDRDLIYESAKMMSFAVADGIAQVIPFGIGAAGRALSTAGKVGSFADRAGKTLSTVGKALGATQGVAGAAGIAYAYERGAFQESLAQNLANAEQEALDRSKNDIYNSYNSDAQYKSQIDALTEQRAVELKAEYIANLGEDRRLVDESALDEAMRNKAREEILGREIQAKFMDYKQNNPEFAKLQTAAINKAGQAALNTFLPEAAKYGLVNYFGHRRFLYTNPTSLVKKAKPAIEGIKEVTTSAGRQRLMAEASKFATNKQKWAQLGKQVGRQVWGGFWTNGTDDMMVDAAERINNDSFNQYLNAFHDGRAIADVYGFGDGLYSYWNGLYNSLGQRTTWEAGIVGGLGSIISAAPNMANVVSLATKEGRDAYKNAFTRRNVYETDASGFKTLKRDANGNPVTEAVSAKENWRDRAAFFIQNGVLSEYYGAKQAEVQAQDHADYINKINDDFDDFKAISGLVSSSIGRDNVENLTDEKTMSFVNAIQSVNALHQISKDEKNASVYSTIIEGTNAKLEKLAHLGDSDAKYQLTEDETKDILGEYYSRNPGLARTEENDRVALESMSKNAKTLLEATEAYSSAMEEVAKVEKQLGHSIDNAVKFKMVQQKALTGHWENRKDQMRHEIGDTSSEGEVSGDLLIPSLGGLKNANELHKVYVQQQAEIKSEISAQKAKNDVLQKKYNDAVEKLKEAEAADNSDNKLEAEKTLKKATDELENGEQTLVYLNDMLAISNDKQKNLSDAIKKAESDNTSADRVLTSQEIFNLDPVSRARMMRSDNRNLYSAKQQREIVKLESELINKDPDALEKIQDIALLTQRIASSKDAFSRLAQNPDAAAVQLESQISQSADIAYRMIDNDNANAIADAVLAFDEAMKGRNDISEEFKKNAVYGILHRFNPRLLNIIQKNGLIPQYQDQVTQALNVTSLLDNFNAIVETLDVSEEDKAVMKDELDRIANENSTEESIMQAFSDIVNDFSNPKKSRTINKLLKGLNSLIYQRKASIVETLKERKAREELQAKIAEQIKQNALAEAEKAANEATPEEEKKEDKKEEKTETETKKEIEQPASEEAEPEVKPIESEEKPGSPSEETKVKEEPVAVITDEDGDVVLSPTFEEEASEVHQSDSNATVIDTAQLEDANTLNESGDNAINSKDNTLSGNAMSPWNSASLTEEGKLVPKSSNGNDSRAFFSQWLKDNGIELQKIIDEELPLIIQSNDDPVKVKFMAIRPTNANKNRFLTNHLFLVLDYNNNSNPDITYIHNEKNGGVITSNGKKYLVVGVVGYGNRNNPNNASRLALYDTLFRTKKGDNGLVKQGMKEFFDNHPDDYYVPDNLSTEIVPGYPVPGYVVKMLEGEDSPQLRSVLSILKDKDVSRIPKEIRDVKDLAWGIQKETSFLGINTKGLSIMKPSDTSGNTGRVFLLIPASNGKLMPAYIHSLFYTEMNNGKLKDRLDASLMKLASPQRDDSRATRLEALNELKSYLYFSNEGKRIAVSKDGKIVFFKDGDHTVSTVNFENNPNAYEELFKKFSEFNPRINVTGAILSNNNMVAEYDEAGALMTDLAYLHTMGADYSIYPLDAEGKMIKPETALNETNYGRANRTKTVQLLPYMGQRYKYSINSKEFTDYSGKVLEDPVLIEELTYKKKIVDSGIEPSKEIKQWRYYIIDRGENPIVVKEDIGSGKIVKATSEQAKNFVDQMVEEEKQKARDEAARKANEEAPAVTVNDEGEIQIEETIEKFGPSSIQDAKKAEQMMSQQGEEKKEEAPIEQQESKSNEDSNNEVKVSKPESGGTITFTQVARKRAFKKENAKLGLPKNGIYGFISEHFSDAPIKFNEDGLMIGNEQEVMKFLKEKGVNVDFIVDSDEGVKALLQDIRCRGDK